jgi:acyl dehydratase
MTETMFFDEVEVGNHWRSPSRTISEADIAAFADLTGDDNPLHLDAEFASNTPFGRRIIHGLLGLSLTAGLSSHSPAMDTSVFMRILDWQFLKPVYAGDTVHVETEIIEKRPAGRRRGLITWRRRLINQQDEVVQEGNFETLVTLHSRAKSLPR